MRPNFFSIHNKIARCICRRVIALLLCAVFFFIVFVPVSSRARESKVVRVGWYEGSYCYTDKFGRRSGMAYEYQQKLSTCTGWTYEYVEGTWPELMQMLLDGDIDLLSDVSYTPERSERILYPSLPMGTEAYYFYINPHNEELFSNDFSAYEGKTFAVNKGSFQKGLLEDWEKSTGITVNIMEISEQTSDQVIDMLTDGSVDVFVSMDTYGRNKECVPVYKLGASDYYFAVNKSRPDLLKELESALVTIQNEDPFYNQKLYQNNIWSVNNGIIFTREERDWLSEHNTIRVGYRDSYQPFCFQENGELSGALKDFFEYASTAIEGIDINYVPVAFKTTEEAIAALNNGEIDAVFPVNMSAYDSEIGDLFITVPVMKTEIYALVKTGEGKDIFLDNDTRVALLSGNVNFDNFVKDYYPDWEVMWRSPLDEVYGAVAAGEADCAMVNGYRINTTDRLRRRHSLSLLDTGEEMEFSFAVKRQDIILFSVLDKTVGLIEDPVVDTMLSKYTNTVTKISFYDYLIDNLVVVLIFTALILSIIFFLIYNKIQADNKARDRLKLITATERDPLTMLYTRNFFFEYASRMYKDKPDIKMDAIVMNIEQFHVVNALYGWDFGDVVLKALGDEISKFLSESGGIACRSQSDRFDIYCNHTDDHKAIFDRFQKRLDDCSSNVSIRLRMGVMPWQEGLEPVQLFDRARAACNMIRGGQRSRLMVFNEDMREKELLDHRLLNDLRGGVEKHEFVVYYQPKYDIQVDPPRLSSAEALVRWNHHELGMIPPNEFITLFEKTGQIGILDKYVWKEVARQMAEWKDKYGYIVPISVNLSRLDIFADEFEKTIEELVEKSGIGRENLYMEITESAYTENEDQVIDIINRFREKGYHIEMDDFGTGYSSLNMLSRLSIDVLKLDRSFIKDIVNEEEDGKNVRLVELILDIARSLKIIVVAEGVETKEQLDFLKKRGCELVQGFYFSRPLPLEEFEKEVYK